MSEVEKRLKSTNFDQKMAAKSPKAPKSKIRKKKPVRAYQSMLLAVLLSERSVQGVPRYAW